MEKARSTLGGRLMNGELKVNDYYQIKFTLEDGKWVCRWTEEELAFHQKMMNEVIQFERG
jgi:hypothetical protein